MQEKPDMSRVFEAVSLEARYGGMLPVKHVRRPLSYLLGHTPEAQRLAGYENSLHPKAQEQLVRVFGEEADVIDDAAAEHVLVLIAGKIQDLFDHKDHWPEPVAPVEPEAGAKTSTQIAYRNKSKAYKQALDRYTRIRPHVMAWFTDQVVKSFPGRKDSVSDPRIKDSLPEEILIEDWVDGVKALSWYMGAYKDPQTNKHLTLDQLRQTDLHSIIERYKDTFRTEVTSDRLNACDQQFLDKAIDGDIPDEDRHPDTDNVTTHAEILETGRCDDGTEWRLYRLGTKKAAQAYGNPTGKSQDAHLCFAYSDEKGNHFSSYRDDLLMLIRVDGKDSRFIHIREGQYMDITDTPVAREEIFTTYPGSIEAIGATIGQALQRCIDTQGWDEFRWMLGAVKGVEAWEEAATPLAVTHIPTTLQRHIDTQDWLEFRWMLLEVKGVAAWEEGATAHIPTALQHCIDTQDWDKFQWMLGDVKDVAAWETCLSQMDKSDWPQKAIEIYEQKIGPIDKTTTPVHQTGQVPHPLPL